MNGHVKPASEFGEIVKMSSNPAFSETGKLHGLRGSLWQRDWLWGALLIGLVLLAYARMRHAEFIWDDEAHLTQNPCIVGPLGLKEIWTSARAVYYPLVLTTFWIVHKFVGLSPTPYHVVNVLMHTGAALLLWRVLRELGVRGAWLGSALWALHPVMVQSVAWVTELKNTQSCLFYLLSILCFLKADAQERGEPVRWWRFGWALLFFVMAITSKPSTVMLPAVLALCLWWRKRAWRGRNIATLIPFLVISAVASAWTVWEQKFHSGAIGAEWTHTWPERLIIASRALWFYLAKLVWPDSLTFIYPRWRIDASQPLAYLPVLAAAGALAILWLNRNGRLRPLFFAAAYFVISLFPVLGFFDVYFFRYSFVSDHFQYLASMGPLALAAAGITKALVPVQRVSSLRLVVCGTLLFALGFLTWRRSAVYRDGVTLYRDTLKKSPDCWMAHYNLAIALRGEGESEQAVAHYQQAMALRPEYAEAHYNLARILVETGEFEDAIAHYEKALTINSADAEAYNNLGSTLLQIGRVDEAIVRYQKALAIRPDYADASCNLASALLQKGDTDGAMAYYLSGLALSPNQATAQYNVANVLLQKGRTDEAITHYEKTLELRPDNADAHTNLGNAFLQKGRAKDAIAQYRNALQIAPENVGAQTNLAWLLATCADPSLRDGPEAVRLAERASRLSRANQAVILHILAAAYAEAGNFTDAIATAQRALQLAEGDRNTALLTALEKEIGLYRSGSPYHKPQR
jgi:protein O-mannosyl-transferase